MNDLRAVIVEHLIINRADLLMRCGVDLDDAEYNLMFIDDVHCTLIRLLTGELGLNYIDVASNVDLEDVKKLLTEGL